MIHFTLYSRSYCHLCEDMRSALEDSIKTIPHDLTVIDVDQDARLVQLYDELVPILFGKKSTDTTSGPGQQLCHYFFNADVVKAFCHA